MMGGAVGGYWGEGTGDGIATSAGGCVSWSVAATNLTTSWQLGHLTSRLKSVSFPRPTAPQFGHFTRNVEGAATIRYHYLNTSKTKYIRPIGAPSCNEARRPF